MFPSFDSLSDRERQRRRLLEKTQQRLRNEAAMREAFADTIWATDNNTVPSLTKAATAKLKLETNAALPDTASVQDVSMATVSSLGDKRSSVASMTSDRDYKDAMVSQIGKADRGLEQTQVVLSPPTAPGKFTTAQVSDVSMASASSNYATPRSSADRARLKAPSMDSVGTDTVDRVDSGVNPLDYREIILDLMKINGIDSTVVVVSRGAESASSLKQDGTVSGKVSTKIASPNWRFTLNRVNRKLMFMNFEALKLDGQYNVFIQGEGISNFYMMQRNRDLKDDNGFRYYENHSFVPSDKLNSIAIDTQRTMIEPLKDYYVAHPEKRSRGINEPMLEEKRAVPASVAKPIDPQSINWQEVIAKREIAPKLEQVGTGVPRKRLKGRGLKGSGRCYNLNHIQGSGMASAYIYQPIGSKYIRVPDLDKNELSIVYPCRTKVGPKRHISDAVQQMIKRLVYKSDISQSQYDDLSIEDKRLFREILEATHVQHMFSEKLADPIENLKAEFDKCRGEVMLGNDNPDLVKRLRELTVDMFAQRLIDDHTFKQIIASTL